MDFIGYSSLEIKNEITKCFSNLWLATPHSFCCIIDTYAMRDYNNYWSEYLPIHRAAPKCFAFLVYINLDYAINIFINSVHINNSSYPSIYIPTRMFRLQVKKHELGFYYLLGI